jgi:hypothetical protein
MSSAVTVYLLDENYMRDFFMTGLADRANFAKTKWKEVLEGKRTYNLVASWVVNTTGENAAEEVFDMTNNPCRQDERDTYYDKVRSVSVGDIVEVSNLTDGSQYYLCDSFGWVAI